MILDEPTSSLDAHTADQLLAFVRLAVGRGIACLLITQMLGEIERVMVMRDGGIVGVLLREQSKRELIIQMMGQHLEADKTPAEARIKNGHGSERHYQ